MKITALLFSTLLTISGAASFVAFFGASIMSSAHAQPRVTLLSFLEADKDRDKQLDLYEAELAFPLVEFSDANGDGLLSTREAEAAVPGLSYSADNHENAEMIIDAEAYVLLAQQYARTAEGIHQDDSL